MFLTASLYRSLRNYFFLLITFAYSISGLDSILELESSCPLESSYELDSSCILDLQWLPSTLVVVTRCRGYPLQHPCIGYSFQHPYSSLVVVTPCSTLVVPLQYPCSTLVVPLQYPCTLLVVAPCSALFSFPFSYPLYYPYSILVVVTPSSTLVVPLQYLCSTLVVPLQFLCMYPCTLLVVAPCSALVSFPFSYHFNTGSQSWNEFICSGLISDCFKDTLMIKRNSNLITFQILREKLLLTDKCQQVVKKM